ncbi:Arginyl-tRNA--protein transferase 1 [Coemansia erecta]|uniref:arginyltransferase n=1 Tax=Coemansia erecta TaxID=147472 RepID=A0A9W7Y3I8_9FUNG|nr:Arginyl-tRNA--protein transferase 1 [Coemansia erecta]
MSRAQSSDTESELGDIDQTKLSNVGISDDESQYEGLTATESAPGAADTADSKETSVIIHGIQGRHPCGYCKSSWGSRSYVMIGSKLSCRIYQRLIDRGWRRSGTLLYLIDHSDSCCCYYPIRAHALEVEARKSDKKVLRRWQKRFGMQNDPNLGFFENVNAAGGAELKIVMDTTAYSDEKYSLFEKYQKMVHGDATSVHSFKEFLCYQLLTYEQPQARDSSAETREEISRLLPHGLGSYHMCYYIGNELAAVGVIDVLPYYISSVYFFYDPKYSDLSMGSYSSLREISLTRSLHRLIPSIEYYNLGYYVPGCKKMVYKAHWRPADLLDTISFKWVPIERCMDRIARHPGFCTFDPELDHRNIVRDKSETLAAAMPALNMPKEVIGKDIDSMVIQLSPMDSGNSVIPLPVSRLSTVSKNMEDFALQACATMGPDVVKDVRIIV